MRWLKQHTTVLSEERLKRALDTGWDSARPATLITFDDGYRDNYTIAYPLLRELGLPALIFIPTHIIDARRLGWWDIIAYLFKHTACSRVELDGRSFDLPRQRREACSHFQERIKLEPRERTLDLIPRLCEACRLPPPDPASQDRELLTWDQIREMKAHGVSIGGHTHTHTVLATLNPEEQEQELALSKSILEDRLGGRVCSVAYPVGGPQHVSPTTADIAARCGYELGFSYLTGLNRWGAIQQMSISRVAGPADQHTLEAMALLPEVFVR